MSSMIYQGFGFSPLDAIFIIAAVLLIVFAVRKNHRLKEEERELTRKIGAYEEKLTETEQEERMDR